MDNYDLVMAGILVVATLFGAFKGFAWQVASLTSLILSYVAAYKFRDVVTPLVSASPPWNTFTAMLAIYSTSSLVVWVGFRVVADLIDKMKLKHFDRQMGALLGLGKGVLFCTVVTFFAVTLLGESLRRDIVHSKSGHYIAQLLHDSDAIMPEEIKTVLEPYLDNFDKRFEATEPPEDDDEESGDWGLGGQGITGEPRGGRTMWPSSTTSRGAINGADDDDPAQQLQEYGERQAREAGAEFGSRLFKQGTERLERAWNDLTPGSSKR